MVHKHVVPVAALLAERSHPFSPPKVVRPIHCDDAAHLLAAVDHDRQQRPVKQAAALL